MFLYLAFIAVMLPISSGFVSVARSSYLNRVMSLKMQVDINMPALSSTMTEGKIVAWNKKVGDKVFAGDVLLVVESDKADMAVDSYEDGYLAAIYTAEGESALVGAAVATLVASLSEIESVGSAPKPAAPAVAAASATAVSASPSGPVPAFEQIMMPALSSTMTEGKVVSWSKKVGDKISAGDMVLVVESDKADMDVESYEDGFLAAIAVGDGEIASVGSPVGYLAKTKEDVAAVQAYVASGAATGGAAAAPAAAAPAAIAAPVAVAAPVPVAAAPAAVVNTGRIEATPYAKKLAKEKGVDLSTVTGSAGGRIVSKDLSGISATLSPVSSWTPASGTINATPKAKKLAQDNNLDVRKIVGTGNFGRVTPDDVLKAAGKWVDPNPPKPVAAAAPAPAAAAEKPAAKAKEESTVLDGIVPMDGMQKAVAKNMEKTLSVPIFRVSREIYTDDFDALYAALKPKGITVSAMLAKACAEVLKKHPIVNAAYVDGGIKYNKDINIAMAVAIDGGLITPTIINAGELDLFSVGRTWKSLVDKAKAKKLTAAEYSSGTFTISNLGMFGVSQFDAILPPGTGSILAIAASTPKVVQQPNGYFGVRKSMTVTITCDHRHIYGADAAQFLKDLADLLENNCASLTMG
jgi:pyruvate dehydrogenase E2 component (dihydrolipoamide acetyltransferase)